eukprot:TRINITY_DN1436_c1_g1_i1.p3 TRINITY_DN1436_c1_g1~~TRINITY_DN1436_c1_g1_i1.p3  ORF type:complete len:114 (+),score=37.54 TRINITY_DN1436_c1_g1_i1:225-566(+)
MGISDCSAASANVLELGCTAAAPALVAETAAVLAAATAAAAAVIFGWHTSKYTDLCARAAASAAVGCGKRTARVHLRAGLAVSTPGAAASTACASTLCDSSSTSSSSSSYRRG